MVAYAHRAAVGPHNQTLRQYRARPDMCLTDDHSGIGDLRSRLVNQKPIEAHRDLTALGRCLSIILLGRYPSAARGDTEASGQTGRPTKGGWEASCDRPSAATQPEPHAHPAIVLNRGPVRG